MDNGFLFFLFSQESVPMGHLSFVMTRSPGMYVGMKTARAQGRVVQSWVKITQG